MDFSRPHRPPRLSGWDYASPGWYFITFNTRIRGRAVLSLITNVGDAALGVPSVTLTSAGKIIEELIENIPRVYPDASVDSYVIMPDHVHLILVLGCSDGPPKAAVPTSVPKIVNTLKALSSKRCSTPLWQDGYYDHIIRNDEDLAETRQYLQNNPLNWILNKE